MPRAAGQKLRTEQQVSAGGLVYRKTGDGIETALIKVGPKLRWQLPKGIVDAEESLEKAAIREVREETGLKAKIVSPLETIEYWYVSGGKTDKVRYHKFVHFFLMLFVSGTTADHDGEVLEARWVNIADAARMLSFDSERKLVEKARDILKGSVRS